MRSFEDIIRRYQADLRELEQALHNAAKVRDQSPSRREAWQRAALNSKNHHSDVEDYLRKIKETGIDGWAEGRDFVFSYFAVDPMYFWSGHTKQWLIQKIKPLEFDESEKAVIRNLIIGRIHNGAGREFKHFCRLIPRVQNRSFARDLDHLSDAKNAAVAGRAKFASNYLKP